MVSDNWVASKEEDLYVGNRFVSPLIPLTCDYDFNICVESAQNNLIKNCKNPMRIWAVKSLMKIFMQLPFGLGMFMFYLLTMKNSITITSMPRAPDLELEDDVTIVGNNLVSARIGACRSQIVITSMGHELCMTLISDDN